MAWLFAQVWVLCLVAFLGGAAMTWLTFVVPLRRTARRDDIGDHGPPPSQSAPSSGSVTSSRSEPNPEPLRVGRSADPALASLDSWVDRRDRAARPPAGLAAADALDLLGMGSASEPAVSRGGGPQSALDIPTQAGRSPVPPRPRGWEGRRPPSG